MTSFRATLEIIGINPFVFVPEKILAAIFSKAGKDKGPVPVRGTINGVPFVQTLVRYQGHWRLYVNMKMLPRSPERIGERVQVALEFDPADRTIAMHPKLAAALKKNREARATFDGLIPSRKKEIVRYIASLKTEESVERNVEKVLQHLMGNGRFAGR